MEEKEEESKEKKNWYKKREEHWASVEPNLASVLGDEKIQLPDVKCSCELLNGLILSKQLNPISCLDCAAGIGRVTEYVLSNFFKEIDLFEKDKAFLEKCKKKFIGNDKIKNIYESSLENFQFKRKYDLIWIQWCLENLEDDDLRPFLKKCFENLNDNGIIIIKENLYNIDENEEDEIDEKKEDEKKEIKKEDNKREIKKEDDKNNYEYKYSEADYSKQRPDVFYINLFLECNFKIKLHFLNPNWPESMMPLCVYVLTKNKS
jgi:SAM-dependent methyltransferase